MYYWCILWLGVVVILVDGVRVDSGCINDYIFVVIVVVVVVVSGIVKR